MNTTSTDTPAIIPPQAVAEAPRIIAPDASRLFAARAQRFEHLAEGHSLGPWLRFLGQISLAQQAAVEQLQAIALPDAKAIELALAHQMPLLPAQTWQRDPAWRTLLRTLAGRLRAAAPEAARADLDRLVQLPDARLEALAERVLQADLYGDDVALIPYVAAALQACWTAAASRLGDAIQPLDVASVCPCCGFLPVGSVVRSVSGVSNLRYLHCALCNTEWSLPRVRCAACDADQHVHYRMLDGEHIKHLGAVQAETCDDCKSYLKLFHTEKGAFDPVADDLASLALDILVDAAGYTRAGPNLLMVNASA